ncbi:MAG: CapA family protein, partial [Spirochaetia bacterium]
MRPSPLLFLAVPVLLLSAFGCRSEAELPPPRAEVFLETGLEAAWERTLAAYPLPEGIDLVLVSDNGGTGGKGPEGRGNAVENAPKARLILSRTGFATLSGIVELAERKNTALLGINAYVPVTKLLDPVQDIGTADAKSGGYPLLPYGSVRPPGKGMSVEGRYPGDPDYPLYRGVVAELKGEPGESPGTFERLGRWMEGIPTPEPPAPPVWIAAVGDIMPGRGVDWTLTGFDDGIERIFSDTLPLLQGADITLGNLETVISKAGKRIAKSYNFRSPPEVLIPLREAGFDYLSLTNNHCFDYGTDGFLETLEALDAAGILTSGAGRNEEEARKAVEIVRGETPIRILSAGAYPREANGFDGSRTARAGTDKPGILWADSPETAAEILAGVCTEESFDIVMVHGGHEWQSLPSPDQVALYRSFVDDGADLVIGSHPHVLQPMEVYRGSIIAYSLGNFIFPGMEETLYGEETMILRVGITGTSIAYAEVHP